DGVTLENSSTSPLAVIFDTTSRLDGPLTISAIASDLAGNRTISTARVFVDNLQVALHPQTLNLRSKKMERSINGIIEGPNVDLLLPTEDALIFLQVPGGNAVYTTPGFGGDDLPGDGDGDGVPDLVVKFDRQELIQSIRAGISAGMIDPDSQVVLEMRTAGGAVLGSAVVQ